MSLEFREEIDTARFHSPLEDFEETEVDVQIREDPLTGQQTRIVPEVFPGGETRPDVSEFVGDDEGCFFCPDMVGDATPTYPDFVGMERGETGEAVSFPNLFPYGKHSNVVVLTEDHFRPMEDFTTEQFADGLSAALEYLESVVAHDGSEFASINMNLLPSAGSSVVHPHLQTVADNHGTNRQRLLHRHERAYYEEQGESYWQALLEEERDGERYVGSTGEVSWLAPFAPTHHWHVTGITDVVGLPDPGSGVVTALADGITNVLSYYASLNLNAHNFSIRFTDDPASRAVIDVIARAPFDDHYVSDAFFFTTLHDERIVDVPPEEYAPELAEEF